MGLFQTITLIFYTVLDDNTRVSNEGFLAYKIIFEILNITA